jgi:hypothetical protein
MRRPARLPAITRVSKPMTRPDRTGPPCLPAHHPLLQRLPSGWPCPLPWHPTSAEICSITSPSSPTPDSDAAGGMRWPRSWPWRWPRAGRRQVPGRPGGAPPPVDGRLALTRRGHRAPRASLRRPRRPGPRHRRLAGRPAATDPAAAGAPPASGGRGGRQDPARQRPPPQPAGPLARRHGPHQPRGPRPGRRGGHHQRDRPVPAAAGGVGPRRHRGHRRRAPHPTRARRLAGHRQARRLPANGEGQPAHPAPPAATSTLGRHPCPRPHPRPRPRPGRGPPPAGHHRRRPPVRHPSPADHPPDPAACRPALADRDRVRSHQPHRRPGPPCSPRGLHPRPLGIEALHHVRDTTFAEDASQARTGTAPGPWPASATSPSASCAPTVTATSPPPCAATPATPPESCRSSASQAREPDIPAIR